MEGARYFEDGRLVIFKRSGIYYARIRISPVKYIWRSLKTSNEQTAVDLGRRLLFQIEQRAPVYTVRSGRQRNKRLRFRGAFFTLEAMSWHRTDSPPSANCGTQLTLPLILFHI